MEKSSSDLERPLLTRIRVNNTFIILEKGFKEENGSFTIKKGFLIPIIHIDNILYDDKILYIYYNKTLTYSIKNVLRNSYYNLCYMIGSRNANDTVTIDIIDEEEINC